MHFGGKEAGTNTWIAPNATLAGDVYLGNNVTVLFGAVLRADMDKITIGDNSNVQDNAVIHESIGKPVTIGKNVSIGHGAIIHGATIEDGALIGMGAIVLNGAVIGHGSLLGAGAVVTENKVIPPNSLVLGVPGKVMRELTPEEIEGNLKNAARYVEVGRRYANE
ncbi:MAG TPA: gamma carbonic anhydrase family protein [Methanocorpusculum sp.]|nr:gamma carbonic anhydrase family protein [Methanocorpusculum sp.]